MSLHRFQCICSPSTSLRYLVGSEICTHHFPIQNLIHCPLSVLNVCIVQPLHRERYRNQLCKLYPGPAWREKLALCSVSICLIVVAWQPVQVFVFKSDVYQGTRPAGIIITCLSENVLQSTYMRLMGNVKGALSFLMPFQKGHFHTHETCHGSPE